MEPFETREHVRGGSSSREQYAASCYVEEALATAELALDKLKSPPQAEEEEAPQEPQMSSNMSLSQRQQRAVEAEEQVETIWACFDAMRKRGRHFAAFHEAVGGYDRQRTEHELLDRQLQWIFGQVAQV